MRKTVKIGLLWIPLALIIFIGYGVFVKIEKKKDVADRISSLPNFKLLDVEGRYFAKKNLEPAKNTIILYFNSECHFCQDEAREITTNIEKFEEAQLLFISAEKKEQIKNFAANYKLLNWRNVKFLQDSTGSFAKTIDLATIPSVLIYDKEEQLLQKLQGLVKTKTLLAILNDEK